MKKIDFEEKEEAQVVWAFVLGVYTVTVLGFFFSCPKLIKNKNKNEFQHSQKPSQPTTFANF